MEKNKIFLGGTCNESTWRDELIKELKDVKSFNPVVEDWTEESQKIEQDEKDNICNIHLYVITKEMTGVFSIAEAIDSVHNKSKVTILHVIPEGFSESQLRSFKAVVNLVKIRGGIAYIDSDITRTSKLINKNKECWSQ